MKKLNITLLTLLTTGNLLYAGGTFFVEPVYEVEDMVKAEEVVIESAYSEEIVEEYVTPAPVPISAPQIVEQPLVVEKMPTPMPMPIPPAPIPVKDIQTNGLYAGIGISSAEFKTNCQTVTKGCSKSGTDKTSGLMARVGYDVNQYIGVEARGIRTNWKSNGGKIKHAGVFVKPMLPVNDSTNIYALAGLAKTTTQGKLQRVDSSHSFAWGGGVEYDISPDKVKDGRYNRKFDGHGDQEKGLGVFADYERLIQKSGSPDLDTVNVGLTYDF